MVHCDAVVCMFSFILRQCRYPHALWRERALVPRVRRHPRLSLLLPSPPQVRTQQKVCVLGFVLFECSGQRSTAKYTSSTNYDRSFPILSCRWGCTPGAVVLLLLLFLLLLFTFLFVVVLCFCSRGCLNRTVACARYCVCEGAGVEEVGVIVPDSFRGESVTGGPKPQFRPSTGACFH